MSSGAVPSKASLTLQNSKNSCLLFTKSLSEDNVRAQLLQRNVDLQERQKFRRTRILSDSSPVVCPNNIVNRPSRRFSNYVVDQNVPDHETDSCRHYVKWYADRKQPPSKTLRRVSSETVHSLKSDFPTYFGRSDVITKNGKETKIKDHHNYSQDLDIEYFQPRLITSLLSLSNSVRYYTQDVICRRYGSRSTKDSEQGERCTKTRERERADCSVNENYARGQKPSECSDKVDRGPLQHGSLQYNCYETSKSRNQEEHSAGQRHRPTEHGYDDSTSYSKHRRGIPQQRQHSHAEDYDYESVQYSRQQEFENHQQQSVHCKSDEPMTEQVNHPGCHDEQQQQYQQQREHQPYKQQRQQRQLYKQQQHQQKQYARQEEQRKQQKSRQQLQPQEQQHQQQKQQQCAHQQECPQLQNQQQQHQEEEQQQCTQHNHQQQPQQQPHQQPHQQQCDPQHQQQPHQQQCDHQQQQHQHPEPQQPQNLDQQQYPQLQKQQQQHREEEPQQCTRHSHQQQPLQQPHQQQCDHQHQQQSQQQPHLQQCDHQQQQYQHAEPQQPQNPDQQHGESCRHSDQQHLAETCNNSSTSSDKKKDCPSGQQSAGSACNKPETTVSQQTNVSCDAKPSPATCNVFQPFPIAKPRPPKPYKKQPQAESLREKIARMCGCNCKKPSASDSKNAINFKTCSLMAEGLISRLWKCKSSEASKTNLEPRRCGCSDSNSHSTNQLPMKPNRWAEKRQPGSRTRTYDIELFVPFWSSTKQKAKLRPPQRKIDVQSLIQDPATCQRTTSEAKPKSRGFNKEWQESSLSNPCIVRFDDKNSHCFKLPRGGKTGEEVRDEASFAVLGTSSYRRPTGSFKIDDVSNAKPNMSTLKYRLAKCPAVKEMWQQANCQLPKVSANPVKIPQGIPVTRRKVAPFKASGEWGCQKYQIRLRIYKSKDCLDPCLPKMDEVARDRSRVDSSIVQAPKFKQTDHDKCMTCPCSPPPTQRKKNVPTLMKESTAQGRQLKRAKTCLPCPESREV